MGKRFGKYVFGLAFIYLFEILGLSVYYNNMAVLLFGTGFILLGFLCNKLLFKADENSQFLFALFFVVYNSFLLIAVVNYIEDPTTTFFYAIDATKFYSYVKEVHYKYNTLSGALKFISTDFFASEWVLFAYIVMTIYHVSCLLGEPNFYVLCLPIIFCSALIVSGLYKILKTQVSEKNAFIYTLIYGFLSYNFFFSAPLLRDVFIGFLFLCSFYIILIKPFSYKYMGVLLLISIMTFFFRPEHGLFSVLSIPIYFYSSIQGKGKNVLLVLMAVFCGAMMFMSGYLTDVASKLDATSSNYSNFSLSEAGDDSMGAALLKLPFGVRHIAVGLFSMILPFPFYRVLDQGLTFLPLSIGSLFWFTVTFSIIYLLFKRKFKDFQDKENLLLLMAVLLVLLNISSASTRRIMCVFPIFYLFFVKLFSLSPVTLRRGVTYAGLSFYLLIIVCYLFLKL